MAGSTEIIASDIQMLDSKGGSAASGYDDMPQTQQFAPSSAQQTSRQQAPQPQAAHDAFDQIDDDIPF